MPDIGTLQQMQTLCGRASLDQAFGQALPYHSMHLETKDTVLELTRHRQSDSYPAA